MTNFNDRSTPMSLLLSRRSGKARDMVAPGPDADELRQILSAAMRVPDHGKLAPWRFVIVPENRRDALADALFDAWRSENPTAQDSAHKVFQDFTRQAPCLVISLFSPRPESPIPLKEQEYSSSAATMTLAHAAHAAGYVSCWLTGWAAHSDAVTNRIAKPGEHIVGFVFLGTPGAPLKERPRPDYDDIVSSY